MQGPSNPGFGVPNAQGVWGGFNVEICRAIAITIFNDPSKVEFVPVTTQSRFPALTNGEVDVLSNNTTWTLTRDTGVNRFNFPAIVFYDGQAVMVPRRLNVTSARQLNGATVCVQPGTTTELNLADFFRQNNMTFRPVVIEALDELRRAYDQGRCDIFTNDFAALAAQRTLLTNPRDHVILPERISKEPLGPTIRQGDEELTNIVAWTVFALIDAEEFGITQANVDQIAGSATDPRVRRLLGVEPGMARPSARPTTSMPAPSSRPSAITARSSSVISASTRPSASSAARTTSGPRAACSTPRRPADRASHDRRPGARHAPRGSPYRARDLRSPVATRRRPGTVP